ncbi:MAG: hypothetical protein LBJ00_12625 [Planctomycetaceae bacterium]|nr:hypothetical protein [Planctomycetaceae bacterium]
MVVIVILALELLIGGALSFLNGEINNLENKNNAMEKLIDKGNLESKFESSEKNFDKELVKVNDNLTAEINILTTEINSLKNEITLLKRELITLLTPPPPPTPIPQLRKQPEVK